MPVRMRQRWGAPTTLPSSLKLSACQVKSRSKAVKATCTCDRPPDWLLRTGRYSRRRPHSHGPRNLGRTNASGIVPCCHDPSPAGQQATSENMNNQKSVGTIASAVSTSKSAAGETVDAFIALVSKAVVEGEGVQLVGFGTFGLGQRAARTGRNPRTRETLQLLLPPLPIHVGKGVQGQVEFVSALAVSPGLCAASWQRREVLAR